MHLLSTFRNTCTPPYSCDYLISQLCDSSAMHKICRASIHVHMNYQNGGKCDLCDFDCGMIVGARWGGLSISNF